MLARCSSAAGRCSWFGHAYEGKRPAFLSNLFQLLIGPMFLMAETAFALGLRSGLKHRVEAAAAAYQSR